MTECGQIAIADRAVHAIIEEQWKTMPRPAREFLLGTPLEVLTLHRFFDFWKSPLVVEYLWNLFTGKKADASLAIASNYLSLGRLDEARALMLNGCFVMDCIHSGIRTVFSLAQMYPGVHAPCVPELKHIGHAYCSAKTPQAMGSLLQRLMGQHNSKRKDVATSWRQSGDVIYSDGSHRKPSSNASPGVEIQVILADDADAEERKILTIGSSTNLKTLFSDYAEKRGVSLRTLRFSYNGKVLFLSSAGNRTPDDLNMKDQDVITVRNLNNISSEASNASTAKKKNPTPKKNVKRHKNSRKRAKGKGKKEIAKRKEATKTLEEYRSDHSKLLSKLLEEVQPRLKEIRTRLNALDIERQPRKQKGAKRGRNKVKEHVNDLTILPNSGVGGKAGRPCFLINVGEVQNLYKTSKSPQTISCNTPALDLHGCTSIEARHKLDESLPTWVNTAMRGSYPFLISVKIVCGCGNQVLSDTVENWIRENTQVANSPKRGY